jgi:hypothetical protein
MRSWMRSHPSESTKRRRLGTDLPSVVILSQASERLGIGQVSKIEYKPLTRFSVRDEKTNAEDAISPLESPPIREPKSSTMVCSDSLLFLPDKAS